ncbi:MAG: hypothetical protein E6706_00945 [Anaerococcus hydrogenalis]|uniref:hypothetical protein n=1 Tax=Anaerococcus octavius TaxID=54007 RepID=UPI0027B91C6A|nr:hypothetical protein [Anaerococcus octavius]MDU3152838.1 hypothetical protein [Anaerococcus hydrogenalis]
MDKFQVKILDIKEEYKYVWTYTLEKPDDLNWDEGSSFHLALPGYDETGEVNKKLIHHLSINTLTSEGNIRFTTKIPIRKSPFKKTLSSLKIGDTVTIFKLKSHMSLKRENRPLVALSQGLAMSTIRPLIKRFEEDNTDIPEFISVNVNTKDTHLYESDFENIDGSLLVKYWLDSRSDYLEKIKELANDRSDSYFYVVGSENFLLDTLFVLLEEGISEQAIVIDKDKEKRDIFLQSLENYNIIY